MGRRMAPLVVLVAGCGLFPDLEGLSGDAVDATHDVNVLDAADAGDAATTDGGKDAVADGPSCTGVAGPVAVPAGTYCVDSTEVTVAQYNAWLATNPPLSTLASCSWKTTHAPDMITGAQDSPITWIDWCDAYDYCAWAGKHLCGDVAGGTLASGKLNTISDAWYAACAHAGAYPYGNVYDPSACNGPERDAGGPLPATSLSKCAGGYPGLFEMVGNVYEWTDSCTPTTTDGGPRVDPCACRGGSFFDPPGASQTCSYASKPRRNFTDNDIGFRCCSDLK